MTDDTETPEPEDPEGFTIEETATIAFTTMILGLILGFALSGLGSSYNHSCEDLLEQRTITYNGEFNDYNSDVVNDSLVIDGTDENGGILLAYLPDSDTVNITGDRLPFTMKEEIWLECSDGRINVHTYLNGHFKEPVNNSW